MERIIRALTDAITNAGVEAVLMPQGATINSARMELYLGGLEVAGESRSKDSAGGWQKITFLAYLKTEGTHETWLTDTALLSGRLALYQTDPMPVVVMTGKRWALSAHWKRLVPGRFEYPDEEQAGKMPVSYVEQWQVELAFPSDIVGWTETSNVGG